MARSLRPYGEQRGTELRPEQAEAYTVPMHDQPQPTPMMKQYWRFKAEVPDAILFFHLGDFYETFYEDAEIVARELDIVLTSRNGHPMAGVPVRRGEAYIQQLLHRGHKVAVCQQVEDPKQATGLVRRDIVRVITPGTVIDDSLLDSGANNYLVSLWMASASGPYGLALLDLSTGEFACTVAPTSDALRDELARRTPSETLLPQGVDGLSPLLDGLFVTEIPLEWYEPPHQTALVTPESEPALRASGAIRAYIASTQRSALAHVQEPRYFSLSDHMDLDAFTISSLELVKPLREGTGKSTLLHALDATSTPMGRRRLRRMILSPLTSRPSIEDRLDAVAALLDNVQLRQQLRAIVGSVHDMERLLGRLGSGRMRPSDLHALLDSLDRVPRIGELLSKEHALPSRLAAVHDRIADSAIRALSSELSGMLVDQPPADARDGGLIRAGYDDVLDALRSDARGIRSNIAALEARERQATGIATLKVGHNRVFGYYFEVTQTNKEKVPTHYHRRQTLVNAERFVTEELQALEERVVGADDEAKALEIKLFDDALRRLEARLSTLQAYAEALSEIDVYLALAEVAHSNNYVRPTFTDAHRLVVRSGRHPVVERLEEFVPNDIDLDADQTVVILTGPNMAGKSVYLRQTALISLMAQMGSFVPAEQAILPVVDRVFARVGASDMLSSGISTFMMEMLEVSAILRRATSRSLIILDEMGRGTSTFDGVSIAWAVAHELATRVHAKTLFATHYQELTRLSEEVPGVVNLHIAVKELGREVVFLHRVEKGVSRGSYGIHVARLAGLPDRVTDEADTLLQRLLQEESLSSLGASPASAEPLPLFGTEDHPVLRRLRALDVDTLTPLEALQLINQLQQQVEAPRR